MQDRICIDIETVPAQGLLDKLLETAVQKIDKPGSANIVDDNEGEE